MSAIIYSLYERNRANPLFISCEIVVGMGKTSRRETCKARLKP